MFKVHVQNFNGNWEPCEFETRQDVWDFIVAHDMANAIEIEGTEFEGKIPSVEELEAWVKE